MMRALAAFLLGAALSAGPARALVGDWTSYTHLSEIRDLEAFEGSLWVATGGGIRRVPLDRSRETVYRNTEGLLDVSIMGLAATPDGNLWATSESGRLYRLSADRKRWEVFGTSYLTAAWKMKRRAVIYRAPYLVLGSVKGLTFFHTGKGMADANITRFGQEKGVAVNAVAMEGDTLFVGTGKGIFRAALRLDRLLTDQAVNIYNPEIWTRVPGTELAMFHRPAPPPAMKRSAFLRDTVHGDTIPVDTVPKTDSAFLPKDASLDSAHGFLYYTHAGIASEYEGGGDGRGARLARYGRMRLGDSVYPNAFLMETVESVAGRYFLAHAQGLYEFHPAYRGYEPIRNPEDLPTLPITLVSATRHGVIAAAAPLAFRLEGRRWDTVPGFFQHNYVIDPLRNGSHTFDVLGPDRFYYGTWGLGFHAHDEGRRLTFGAGDGTSCLGSADQRDPRFGVIMAQVPWRDRGMLMSVMRADRSYSLAYFDRAAGSLDCIEVDAKDRKAYSLEVLGDTLVAVTEGGIESFRVVERDGKVGVDAPNLTPGLRSPEPTQKGKLDRLGNYWVTTLSGNIFFIPSFPPAQPTAASYKPLEGFPGRECKNIDRDARGHIWAGCQSGGVVEITPGRDSASHAMRRYGLNDGLLSETIYHLSVDSGSGRVWVVTDRGLASYQSASRPERRTLASARVYPNPFLARHGQVVFDGLASGSEIQVLTQSGSVVYSRKLAAADGDQLRWDGRNLAGARIREGVYFWVIRSPRDHKRGKIIVAR